jgi:S-formylglutathione hydrolase FrmB
MALVHCDFFSDVLGLSASINVILPQRAVGQIGMDGVDAGAEPLPVLYLLHGLSDDHTIWCRRTSIERYAASRRLAIVMPAVHRSYYADMADGNRYWTYVSEELPVRCREFFHISSERKDTFAAGLSMGGFGAFKLGLAHPDRFAAVASLSGALDPVGLARVGNDPQREREFTHIFGDLSAVKGSINDLQHLAQKVVRSGGPVPRLFQCCGSEDFLIESNREFRDYARKIGLKLKYDESPGTHEWGYWDARIQEVLAWMFDAEDR